MVIHHLTVPPKAAAGKQRAGKGIFAFLLQMSCGLAQNTGHTDHCLQGLGKNLMLTEVNSGLLV